MFQRIIVPLDGSYRAEQALPIAAQIARASGGTVLLLQVISPLNEFIAYVTLEPIPTPLTIKTSITEAQTYLKRIRELSALKGIAIETSVVEGPVATTILSTAALSNRDLIVMCSHGYTGMTQWALGSVAEKVAHQTSIPVLLLREGSPTLIGSFPREGSLRVLVPLDGSTLSRSAIDPAVQFVSALSAQGQGSIHLALVVTPSQIDSIDSKKREVLLQTLKQDLNTIAEDTQTKSVLNLMYPITVTWSLVLDKDIASGIINVAENGEDTEGVEVFGRCDAIVMTTHGRGAIQRMIMGSIAERVLHGSKLPLLLVRPANIADLLK